MTISLFLIFVWVLLGIIGGMIGVIVIYKRQYAIHSSTLETIQRFDAELLGEIRLEGLSRLQKTDAGRALLGLLKENGELVLANDEWSNVDYRKKKRMDARRKEIEIRSKHLASRNSRAKSVADA